MKVCILAEGCYPVVRGGLSEWAHMLIKNMDHVDFDIFSLTMKGKEAPQYEQLPNVQNMIISPLISAPSSKKSNMPEHEASRLAQAMRNMLYGDILDVHTIMEIRKKHGIDKGWMASRAYWNLILDFYKMSNAEGSFIEVFWTIYGLYAVLLDTIYELDTIPRADVYHCLSTGYSGLAGALASVRDNAPLVLTEQGLYLLERRNELSRKENITPWYHDQLIRFSESIVKTSYKYATVVVPPCKSHTKIERELGLEPEKIKIIANGIETERFPPGPSHNGHAPVIGCFARVVPIKGIEVLIKAAKIVLEKHDAEFVVVGEIQDKEYFDECEKLVQELGITDKFKFAGYSDPVPWYHKTDIFTLSSHSEGVPYALLEAMCCGIPAVCTSVGGMPEIIEKDTGYVVPPNQPDKLAEKFSLLLENKELRRQMGKRAITVGNAKYHIRDMTRNFYNLYKEITDGRNGN